MSVIEKLKDLGYEDVVIFDNPSYEDAIVGVSHDNRAIYDFNLMVMWLIENEEMEDIDAIEFIEYNTIRSLPYYDDSPIILYPIDDL